MTRVGGLFGQGKVALKPLDVPFPDEWGAGPHNVAYCIRSASPRGTLDGLSIEAPLGTIEDHRTCERRRGSVGMQEASIFER